MTEEKKRNSGADYKYLALKPSTYERLTRLMPGKRHYDNLVNLCIDAYVMNGGVYGKGVGSGVIKSEPGEILKCGYNDALIRLQISNVYGVDCIYFNLADITSNLDFGKRLSVYIENKPELYAYNYFSSEPSVIWINVAGLHTLFTEYKKNIPKDTRGAVFRDVYTLLCWCEQFRPASAALELHGADEVF